MIQLLTLVALFAAVVSAGTLPHEIIERSQSLARLDGKIINGEETTIEENPHQISIQYNNGHFCGGSIVSKHWVLTAAHCLLNPLSYYTVLAGTADQFDKKSTGSVHKADGIIAHPDFIIDKYGALVNDVALLHVLEPFEFDETRQPIELFNKNEEVLAGSLAVITGWGSTGKHFAEILNLVEIPIIAKNVCAKQYQHRGGLHDGQICAAYDEGGKDSCQGDSGGPLSIDGRLAGIVSWGEGCGQPGRPGVYTEVAYFRDWIQSVVSV